MMNAGNLKEKTRQISDWRRRLLAFVLTLSLLISSCGLTAFAESDDDVYSAPVTAPIPAESSTSPEPDEASVTPAPEGEPETGTESEEGTPEGTEPEEGTNPEEGTEPEEGTNPEEGTEPETAYKGSLNLRFKKPETHRRAAIYALTHNQSLNSFIDDCVVERLDALQA